MLYISSHLHGDLLPPFFSSLSQGHSLQYLFNENTFTNHMSLGVQEARLPLFQSPRAAALLRCFSLHALVADLAVSQGDFFYGLVAA